jgi:hypothetical protein
LEELPVFPRTLMAVQTFRDFKIRVNLGINDEKFVFVAEKVKIVAEVGDGSHG